MNCYIREYGVQSAHGRIDHRNLGVLRHQSPSHSEVGFGVFCRRSRPDVGPDSDPSDIQILSLLNHRLVPVREINRVFGPFVKEVLPVFSLPRNLKAISIP